MSEEEKQETSSPVTVGKNNFHGHKASSARRKNGGMLREWYGSDSEGALFARLPKTETLADVLGRVSKGLIPPWVRAFALVEDQWPDIVGPAAAKKLFPLNFQQKTLLIELKHAAYRQIFDVPSVRQTIVSQVNKVVGEDLCDSVKFCIPGQFRRG